MPSINMKETTKAYIPNADTDSIGDDMAMDKNAAGQLAAVHMALPNLDPKDVSNPISHLPGKPPGSSTPRFGNLKQASSRPPGGFFDAKASSETLRKRNGSFPSVKSDFPSQSARGDVARRMRCLPPGDAGVLQEVLCELGHACRARPGGGGSAEHRGAAAEGDSFRDPAPIQHLNRRDRAGLMTCSAEDETCHGDGVWRWRKGGRSGAAQKLKHSTVRILTDISRRSMNAILLHPQSCSAAPALSHGIYR